MPPIVTESPPLIAYETMSAVTDVIILPRDGVDLTARFNNITVPRVAQSQPTTYEVGDTVHFWVKNINTNQQRQVEAELVYRSEALNLWLQAGEHVAAEKVQAAAEVIETDLLPTNRAFFGHEWQPGIDGDNRINILHLDRIGGVASAYFSPNDEYVTAVHPYSNQREILYVSLKDAPIGSNTYYRAIAHEMQHLIQWNTDSNEDGWLNEGMAELAVHLNGFMTGREKAYVNQTDVQLNNLSQDGDVIGAHYAAAFLLTAYFFDRFGGMATQALVNHPENGIEGFNQVLAELSPGLTFDDVFADWLVTNYLQGIGRGEGKYQYHTLQMPPLQPESVRRLPARVTTTVNQYGADFIELKSSEPVTVVFTGTQQTKLVDTVPHSGRYFWFSYPADGSDMHLTRRFDLTGLTSATFSFWTWYDIESGWDYGYVTVSSDDGRTWKPLETNSTTYDNPQGNSYGPGYTGVSGRGAVPMWIQETADLTPYVGRSILVRFQYITDAAVHEQGFIVDDIAIPELGYQDDIEGGTAGWEAVGFVRGGNVLPQRFIVQRLLIGPDDVQIDRLLLDENQQGQWQFPMDNRYNHAILIVAGVTPVTRHPAAYTYEINR